MKTDRPVYCCIPIEFIQPWDQNWAIRQVKELGLGNMVIIQGTFHVGNSDEDRRFWKEKFPSLAAQIDARPRFPERPRHGMTAIFDLPIEFRLEQLRLCRELGLKAFCSFFDLSKLPPEDHAWVREAVEEVVYSECFMGESLSILGSTLSLEQLRKMDAVPTNMETGNGFKVHEQSGTSVFDHPESLDFQVMHDWLVGRFRAAGERLRTRGVWTLSAIEASAQIRLAMAAGADVPLLELVPHEPLRGLAATRGAARAYGKPDWGVHTALGYYRNPANGWTPERLRLAYNLFFAAGANIFSECNLPLRNWGLCSAFFTIQASPAIQEGDVECREFDDPLCVRGREVVSEHYRFTQFHQRPASGPRVRMGYLLGNLDGWTGVDWERMWLVDQPGFLARDALKTWRHFERAFDSEPWYAAPRKYYWQADPMKPLHRGTPPCGQVDIVPVEASAEALQSYGCLAFLGWNTMTGDQYTKLKGFVEQGGTLFLGLPQLDTRARADRPAAFFRGGDVRDLCGVRILGRGESVEEIFIARQSAFGRERFPKAALYLEEATMAKLELCGAQVLAYAREKPDQPVLLEHRVGKGVVYLLANWEYPGTRLDAFLTDILRTLAEAQQAEIAVESRDVFYALYDGTMPSGAAFSLVYLVNHDIYGQAAYPTLDVRGVKLPVRVPGCGLRLAWVLDGLVVAPHDRFVNVTDATRGRNAWTVILESLPPTGGAAVDAERLIQVEALAGSIRDVRLDGRPLAVEMRPEGDRAVRCRLSGRSVVCVELE